MRAKCLEIFKIKYKDKEYGCYEFSQYCKKHKLIPNEEIKKSNLIYGGVEMPYDDYQRDLKITSKKFKPDRVNTKYMLMPDFVFLYDTDLYVCLCFLNTLCTNISAGYHYALLSYDKIPFELYGIKGYASCFFRRSLDFSTSILWYNTIVDYFLQIFCTKFDLYKKITKRDISSMTFEEISTICTYNKIKDVMDKTIKSKENKNMFLWWSKITKCLNNLSWIRKRANSLKHKSGVSINNLDFKFMEIHKGSKKMSEAYTSLPIDIDKDFIQLINAHNEIVKLYSYITKKINDDIEIKKLEWEQKVGAKTV